ncbi:S41 family peptidase [Synechococcus elongatus IITB7]|uniref:S41 family peptidase n=1 Tax=Synechococcus elongatus TaxID=32046 RepID=UPI0030CBCD5C
MSLFSRLRVSVYGSALLAASGAVCIGVSAEHARAFPWQDSPKVVLDQAWQLIDREYVDPTFNRQDWQAVRRELLSRNYGSSEEAYAALRSALRRLDDPYTRFLPPEQFKTLTEQTAGESSGIGIEIVPDSKDSRPQIRTILDNSPASQSDLRVGDRILSVNDESTRELTLDEVRNRLQGSVGSELSLKLQRGDRIFSVKLVRAQIEIPSVNAELRQHGGRAVGYIQLKEFTAHAAREMRTAIRDLDDKGVDSYVLDLRGNPGGLLYSSIEIARMWLNNGAIVKTVDRNGKSETINANNSALTNKPLAVLVDQNSASSSEILVGALKDNNRAVVIGRQTFGKALVQSVHTLADGSGLAVTVAHYYTPNGTDLGNRGIQPDVEVRLNQRQQALQRSDPSFLGSNQDPTYGQAIATLERRTAETTPTPAVPSQLSQRPSEIQP